MRKPSPCRLTLESPSRLPMFEPKLSLREYKEEIERMRYMAALHQEKWEEAPNDLSAEKKQHS